MNNDTTLKKSLQHRVSETSSRYVSFGRGTLTLRRTFAAATIALLATAHDLKMTCAQDWPTRAVTVVVPFAAGGGTDLMARMIAEPMSRFLGQQVIIENRAVPVA
jgi:hypothetical protein